ncbi:unnamed protein product [Lathyrus oleraceus]
MCLQFQHDKNVLSLGTFCVFFLVALVASSKFEELFQPGWAMDHFVHEGDLLKLKLDKYSGGGELQSIGNKFENQGRGLRKPKHVIADALVNNMQECWPTYMMDDYE